jgi:hypothetical protein
VPHPLESHAFRTLFTNTGARSRRASSWDRTGGNRDFLSIGPGETATLMEHEGPGCVTHFYCALAFYEITDYRDAIVRCYWDGETEPSVEVPLGDFFGIAHARVRTFRSQAAAVNRGGGSSYGLNLYLPMPFDSGARITLENRGETVLGGMLPAFWYHVEYESYDKPLPEGTLRFHAQYRQERPTVAVGERPNQQLHSGTNIGGADNYVALEAQGAGQMVGLLLEVNNLAGGWYGEGDDMVFIDGDTWPPSIHGTGSEEIFGGGACPSGEYAGPFSGFHLVESQDFAGLVGMYRWYLHDPIRFTKSIRWTLEHGHANNFANEYSSVVYWYQTEPHTCFPALPGRDELRPPLSPVYYEARDAFFAAVRGAIQGMRGNPGEFFRLARIGDRFYEGDFAGLLEALAQGRTG